MKEEKGNIEYRFQPNIELESTIGSKIYEALQGNIVENIIQKIKTSGNDVYWRSSLEGHSLKVDKELLPDFYNLCQEVKDSLNYTDNVDFYITSDSTVNAFTVAADDEGQPHIININSALFTLMNRDELKFVIGHELGHLINKDTALMRLIHFVFPPEKGMPISLHYKIRLHEQLAELVADRYGFLAVKDLNVCVTAFFKLASGLDLTKMNVSIDALIADNHRRLDYFLNDQGCSRNSHPVNPIRVQALNLFATAPDQETLNKGMDELIGILLKVGSSEIHEHIAHFIASAGIIVASCDQEISEEEVQKIVGELSALKIFPRDFLDTIAKDNIGDIFNNSVSKILEINPGMRETMLSYMVHLILSDKNIADSEIEFLYNFGKSINFSEIEIATLIATAIQQNYIPHWEVIS